MIGDFFTKPLQGNLFRRFRDFILNDDHGDTPRDALPIQKQDAHRSVLDKVKNSDDAAEKETTGVQADTECDTSSSKNPNEWTTVERKKRKKRMRAASSFFLQTLA